jgi:hypothetical protein
VAESGRLKDVDPNSPESLFDVIITRKRGIREGWTMVGNQPVCIVLTHEITKQEAQEMIDLARTAADPVNILPI